MLKSSYARLAMVAMSLALFLPHAAAQRGADLARRKGAAEHGWLFNYDQAKQLARRTNRPLMVVLRCVP